MRATLITPPAGEPLGLAAVKLYLKQDSADSDTEIAELIRTSRHWCESYTRRAMLLQTWKVVLDGFPMCTRLNPKGAIVLPKGRTASVAWIKYTDPDGVEQTLTGPSSSPVGTGYQEDLSDEHGGVLVPAYGQSWPSVRDVLNPVQVQFACGYAAPEDIPAQLLDAMRYRIATLYEGRGEQDSKEWQGIAESVAGPYVIDWFGR